MDSPVNFELPSLERLQSAEQSELLDVIDSLRSQGMGDFISLPQLIVCGDQSSGKSSVLEAISGIPFPRQDTLCTRFATEVILRRTPKERVTASIVPSEGRNKNQVIQLKEFQHELKTEADFQSLFKNAGQAMGLSITDDATGISISGQSFCRDILRIEICGPTKPQLTLVDLPGLIHSATKSQTKEDVSLVHDLVEQYLKSSRSIILAIVSAKNDIGNQIILESARKHDKQGRRTLGIITKPDLLIKGSRNEQAFITLARNEDVVLNLGWHVIKNIDSAQPESKGLSRDTEETRYFERSNFNRLSSHKLGVSFLRSRLSRVLFDQIRTELPALVQEINLKILKTKQSLDRLGPSRAETEKQREYMISLSQTFHSICRDAVKGNYDHEFFLGAETERRLCAAIMNLHFEFAKNMRQFGATWNIVEGTNSDATNSKRPSRTREDAIEEACILLKRSRGRELPGLPNPALVGELFRQYSEPWQEIAMEHIRTIWETTNRFLELLLKHLADEEVCEKIQNRWLFPKMEERLKVACEKLDELIAVHEDQPMTTNTQFLRRKRAVAGDKSKDNLNQSMIAGTRDAEDKNAIKWLPSLRVQDFGAPLDVDMLAAEEAFDNMNAFYEVALTLFTDNVPTLAVQLPIIRVVPDILCPIAVMAMSQATIQSIAGESEEKILERTAFTRKLKILEDGGRLCKQYAKRVIWTPSATGNAVELETSAIQKPQPDAKKELTVRNGGSKPDHVNPLSGISPNFLPPQPTTNPSIKPTSGIFSSLPQVKPTGGLFSNLPPAKPTGGPFSNLPTGLPEGTRDQAPAAKFSNVFSNSSNGSTSLSGTSIPFGVPSSLGSSTLEGKSSTDPTKPTSLLGLDQKTTGISFESLFKLPASSANHSSSTTKTPFGATGTTNNTHVDSLATQRSSGIILKQDTDSPFKSPSPAPSPATSKSK